jgi:hypothetical protein
MGQFASIHPTAEQGTVAAPAASLPELQPRKRFVEPSDEQVSAHFILSGSFERTAAAPLEHPRRKALGSPPPFDRLDTSEESRAGKRLARHPNGVNEARWLERRGH